MAGRPLHLYTHLGENCSISLIRLYARQTLSLPLMLPNHLSWFKWECNFFLHFLHILIVLSPSCDCSNTLQLVRWKKKAAGKWAVYEYNAVHIRLQLSSNICYAHLLALFQHNWRQNGADRANKRLILATDSCCGYLEITKLATNSTFRVLYEALDYRSFWTKLHPLLLITDCIRHNYRWRHFQR